MKKLFASFDIDTPDGLLEMVWFSIMYWMARRGRQNLRLMKKTTFAVDKDAHGNRFVYQVGGEADKNHDENDGSDETSGEGIISETGGPRCPVACFVKYLSVLNPHLDELWQRPRPKKMTICDRIWYCNAPLGEKTLGNMMSTLSAKYMLSRRYTNHCLRVTSLQVMQDGNIETRHIQRVSGHKNPESVTTYARRLSKSRKRQISSVLADSVRDPTPGEVIERAEPSSVNVTMPTVPNQPPDQPMPDFAELSQMIYSITAPPTAAATPNQPSHEELMGMITKATTPIPIAPWSEITSAEICMNDDEGDALMAQVPVNFLNNNSNNNKSMNIPGVLAPVLNNCNNITFHVHIHNN